MLPSLEFRDAQTLGSTLHDAEGGAVAERLVARGMDAADAAAKAKLFAAAAQRLRDEGIADDAPTAAFWVPGRVEVLGKHTDYAGGRSLLAAISKGFAVVARTRNDATVRINFIFIFSPTLYD